MKELIITAFQSVIIVLVLMLIFTMLHEDGEPLSGITAVVMCISLLLSAALMGFLTFRD